jgi:hypothetical protein
MGEGKKKEIPTTTISNTKFDVNDLFVLDYIASLVDLAFSHAESMTESNDKIYEDDFEANKVKEIDGTSHHCHLGSSSSFSMAYELEEKVQKGWKRDQYSNNTCSNSRSRSISFNCCRYVKIYIC